VHTNSDTTPAWTPPPAADQVHDLPGSAGLSGAGAGAGGGRWVRLPVDLDAIAERVGANEVRARRRRVYEADRLTWSWYLADYDRRRGWAAEHAAHRARRTTPSSAQTELGLPLETRAYPRTGPAGGRACWTQAREAAIDYLSTRTGQSAAAAAA